MPRNSSRMIFWLTSFHPITSTLRSPRTFNSRTGLLINYERSLVIQEEMRPRILC